MAVSFKKDKFQERLLGEINMILRNLSDRRLEFVSITKVDLSKDFSHGVVYWDTFDPGKRGDAKKAMENLNGKIRSVLASKLAIRHVPALSFKYDARFEAEQAIDKILGQEKEQGRYNNDDLVVTGPSKDND